MSAMIRDICGGWSEENIVNLAYILQLTEDEQSIVDIENKIKWYFHSKARAQVKAGFKSIATKFARSDVKITVEDQYELPSYSDLIDGLLTRLKINKKDVSLEVKEEFICQAVIAEALVRMSPEQRQRVFHEKFDLGEFMEQSDSTQNSLSGVMKTLGAISLANAAGFSLYTSSTMALSFVSSMMSITLPFSVYTTMTTAISVIVGPAGWTALGGIVAWKLTSTDWGRLKCALLYIISVRSRARLRGE